MQECLQLANPQRGSGLGNSDSRHRLSSGAKKMSETGSGGGTAETPDLQCHTQSCMAAACHRGVAFDVLKGSTHLLSPSPHGTPSTSARSSAVQ